MAERGYLGKWGPNHAADPIVTRFDPASGKLQVVAIVRRDTGAVALPGGMVDPGERVTDTVKREFMEEALNVGGAEEAAKVGAQLTELFAEKNGILVYQGYVDDPRNTDHAWMETAVFHYHADGAAARLQLMAGDDAAHAFWQDVDDKDETYAKMRGKRWIDAAVAALMERQRKATAPQVNNMLMSNMRRR